MKIVRKFLRNFLLNILSINAKRKFLESEKSGFHIVLSHSINSHSLKNLLDFVDTLPLHFFSSMNELSSNKNREKTYKLILTFDDGFKNNLYVGEALAQKGIRACFYINPEVVNNSSDIDYCQKHAKLKLNSIYHEFLNWDDVKYLKDLGHDIGCHTLSHENLGKLSTSKCENEINQSKSILNKEVGEITFFSYPYGRKTDFNEFALKIVTDNEYKFISSGIRGLNRFDFLKSNEKPVILYRENFDFLENSNHLFYFLNKSLKSKSQTEHIFQR